MERTIKQLREMQALPLERKVGITAARITEWVNHWGGSEHAVVSFSGGKDSTVLLYIARMLYPKIPAVFLDTGLEYPEIRDFVKTFPNIDWVRPQMDFRTVIERFGWPIVSKEVAHYVESARHSPANKTNIYFQGGDPSDQFRKFHDLRKWAFLLDAPFKISDHCCMKLKKEPVHAYLRRTGRHSMTAMLAAESSRRTTVWLMHGCNGFDMAQPTSQPMAFWREQDVLEYIRVKQIPICPVYGKIEGASGHLVCTGEARTGCMFCAFGTHLEHCPNKFQRLQKMHPELWNYVIHKMGMGKVLDYIHVPYVSEKTLFDYCEEAKA